MFRGQHSIRFCRTWNKLGQNAECLRAFATRFGGATSKAQGLGPGMCALGGASFTAALALLSGAVSPSSWFPQDKEDWESARNVVLASSGKRCSVKDLKFDHEVNMLPPDIERHWVSLQRDEACNAFLRSCINTNVATHSVKSIAFSVMRHGFGLSTTDSNALLSRSEMFVLSTTQVRQLLGYDVQELNDSEHRALLDVGAGSGSVTSQLAPLFRAGVVATEASWPMAWRLRQRGFAVLRGTDLSDVEQVVAEHGILLSPSGTFDCVALLNVLDRCSAPRSLLRELRERLKPDSGRLLLAVVLPFRPFVESSTLLSHGQAEMSERLPLSRDATWEESVTQLVTEVLRPAGFELEALARVPYLSGGDQKAPVYALDDAVLVLRRADTAGSVVASDLTKTR